MYRPGVRPDTFGTGTVDTDVSVAGGDVSGRGQGSIRAAARSPAPRSSGPGQCPLGDWPGPEDTWRANAADTVKQWWGP